MRHFLLLAVLACYCGTAAGRAHFEFPNEELLLEEVRVFQPARPERLDCDLAKAPNATRMFDALWAASGNADNQFYAKETFGGAVYSTNPMKVVTNQVFRKQVNADGLVCTGVLCRDGQYVCGRHGGTGCYHVEHIVDRSGPLFERCEECKDVAGNRVMAAGQWNMALGGLARSNYCAALREKIIVYGADMVKAAANVIRTCCLEIGVADDESLHFIENVITAATAHTGILNATFDKDCNSLAAEECRCDSDSECGCDCDFELECPAPAAAPIAVAIDQDVAKATLALVGVALCLMVLLNVIACLIVRLVRGKPSRMQSYGPQEAHQFDEFEGALDSPARVY